MLTPTKVAYLIVIYQLLSTNRKEDEAEHSEFVRSSFEIMYFLADHLLYPDNNDANIVQEYSSVSSFIDTIAPYLSPKCSEQVLLQLNDIFDSLVNLDKLVDLMEEIASLIFVVDATTQSMNSLYGPIKCARQSEVGVFARECLLQWRLMSFEQVGALFDLLCIFCDPPTQARALGGNTGVGLGEDSTAVSSFFGPYEDDVLRNIPNHRQIDELLIAGKFDEAEDNLRSRWDKDILPCGGSDDGDGQLLDGIIKSLTRNGSSDGSGSGGLSSGLAAGAANNNGKQALLSLAVMNIRDDSSESGHLPCHLTDCSSGSQQRNKKLDALVALDEALKAAHIFKESDQVMIAEILLLLHLITVHLPLSELMALSPVVDPVDTLLRCLHRCRALNLVSLAHQAALLLVQYSFRLERERQLSLFEEYSDSRCNPHFQRLSLRDVLLNTGRHHCHGHDCYCYSIRCTAETQNIELGSTQVQGCNARECINTKPYWVLLSSVLFGNIAVLGLALKNQFHGHSAGDCGGQGCADSGGVFSNTEIDNIIQPSGSSAARPGGAPAAGAAVSENRQNAPTYESFSTGYIKHLLQVHITACVVWYSSHQYGMVEQQCRRGMCTVLRLLESRCPRTVNYHQVCNSIIRDEIQDELVVIISYLVDVYLRIDQDSGDNCILDQFADLLVSNTCNGDSASGVPGRSTADFSRSLSKGQDHKSAQILKLFLAYIRQREGHSSDVPDDMEVADQEPVAVIELPAWLADRAKLKLGQPTYSRILLSFKSVQLFDLVRAYIGSSAGGYNRYSTLMTMKTLLLGMLCLSDCCKEQVGFSYADASAHGQVQTPEGGSVGVHTLRRLYSAVVTATQTGLV